MNLNPKLTSLAKFGFKYIDFFENTQSEESAIYFKENKFGEDVPIKKKRIVTSLYIFLLCNISKYMYTYLHCTRSIRGIEWYVFVLILLEIIWRRTPRLYSPIVLDDVIKYFLQNVFLRLSLKNASHH